MPVSRPALQPALALTFNAFVWGCSWWPFRQLEALGLHPLWATALIYAVAVAVILALRPRALGQLLGTPVLWLLVLAAGTTNAAFNWAVTVGDVSISAVGFDASASFELDVENDGAGSLGNITVGDVDMTVNGDSAWGWFSVTASSAASGGDITVGDLTLSVGTLAKKTADLNVYIDNDFGDVVVGDINLTGTSVRAVGDVTMDYDANVTLISSAVGGSISIGTISVSGGDGVADNFQALGFLVATPGAGGAVSLGGVDYSGYGVAATLDVSGFAGNTSIVGSAFGDTITDNKGVNAITGGAGADTFTFLDTNVGKTLGAMDSLKDFNDAAGDKIDLTVAVNVGNYGESTYADFAAFAAGAAAADKAVWVGLVGSTGYAAVDYDTNGTVDYMIELVGLTSTGNIDVASFI